MKRLALLISLLITFVLTNVQCTREIVDMYGVISGGVTDVDTGEPVKNATITLTPGGKTLVSGSDGLFQFNELEPKQYKLQVMHDDYITNTKIINVVAGETATLDIQIEKK